MYELKMFLILVSTVVLLGVQGCPQSKTGSEENAKQVLQSQLQFATDFLQTAAAEKPGENVFLGPSTVYDVLLLAYFSSAGKTEETIGQTLRIPQGLEKNIVLGSFFQKKDSYKQRAAADKVPDHYELSSANRLYISDQVAVKGCMKTLFSEEYSATNFKEGAAAATQEINSWVEQHTQGMIKKLVDELIPGTLSVMVSAAYFKGAWVNDFNVDKTEEGDFHLADGSTVKTMMMTQRDYFSKKDIPDLSIDVLEMPYKGDDVSMFILLPKESSPTAIPDLMKKLTNEKLKEVTTPNRQKNVVLTIPKFTVEQEYNLIPILEKMGAKGIFNTPIDLSTLLEGDVPAQFNKAVHKAKVQVDEKGTVAAAAAAIIGLEGGSIYVGHFKADHPFIYLIYDKKTDTVLFAGIFNTPK